MGYLIKFLIQPLGQKSLKYFVRIVGETMTSEIFSEIYWPLVCYRRKRNGWLAIKNYVMLSLCLTTAWKIVFSFGSSNDEVCEREKKASCTNTPFGKGQKYVEYYYSGATRQSLQRPHLKGLNSDASGLVWLRLWSINDDTL